MKLTAKRPTGRHWAHNLQRPRQARHILRAAGAHTPRIRRAQPEVA